MNPIAFVKRRPIITLLLVAILGGGTFLALSKRRAEHLEFLGKQAKQAKEYVVAKYESYFQKHAAEGEEHHEGHKILVTQPVSKEVTIEQQYVCQIHSQKHVEIQALEGGYLEAIPVKEGQAVKKGDLLFQVNPVLYQARLDTEIAEVQYAEQEYNNTLKLYERNAVSDRQVALLKAKLAKAIAQRKQAEAELNFATVKAPFDGIVDRLHDFQGSLIKEGDVLTTLSDNSVMWVYFPVTEKRYLEYKREMGQGKDSPDIELRLADHSEFSVKGTIGAIEAKFNNETGTVLFRADFPNPDGLLRHGQTGTVVIRRKLTDALVIPQRATFENLAKRYVYVVGKDDVVQQREISVQNEQDDIYIVTKPPGDAAVALSVHDKIILEGIRQVHDGEKVEYEQRDPLVVLATPKPRAE